MEYVPLNIKQEPATLQRSETTTVNGSTSSCSNNNSSQAAPDSVENKVSKTHTHTHTYRQGNEELSLKKPKNAFLPLPFCDDNN